MSVRNILELFKQVSIQEKKEIIHKGLEIVYDFDSDDEKEDGEDPEAMQQKQIKDLIRKEIEKMIILIKTKGVIGKEVLISIITDLTFGKYSEASEKLKSVKRSSYKKISRIAMIELLSKLDDD